MATEKISVTVDKAILDEARELMADAGSLSAIVTKGLEHGIKLARLRASVAAFEREHGPIPQDLIDEVDAAWPD
jgi:hypothetical protein